MTSPGPVGFMELSNGVSGTDLVWTPPASPGAGSVNYDLVRSLSATDFGPAATCVESADPLDTVAVDADTPPSPGAVFYYLVRANNACPDGAGSLGWNSAGDARNARSCP